jgi:PAS domain S-box-containing protein
VLGIILLNQDITDFKQAEEDLKYNQANLELKVAERTAQLKQENLQRAQVEQALRESEIKYRNIVDYSTSIVLEWDTQGNVVFLNQYGLEFFGFEPEEILGHKVVGTIVEPVDSRGYDLQGKMLVIQEHPEDFYSSENENVKKNGEKMWIAWTNKGIYDEDGKLFKTLSVGIDRTRQRKVEEQLIKSTEINRLAQEISQAGTWEWDLVRNTLDWSPEFRKVFRLKKNIAPSLESWTQVVYPADREFFTERIQAAIDSRTDLSIEYRIVLPNKGVRWIRMTGKTFLENDQPMRMLGLCLDVTTQKQAEHALLKSRDQLEDLVGQRTKELVTANQRLEQDVTERKQAEQELAVSEARYKSLVDTQSEVIARSNPDGRLIFVNDAYCQAFGRKREELIGNDFIPTVLPDDQPVAASMLEELRLPPHRKPSLTRHITTIGIRWFEWENAAILDEKGNIIELQGTGRDVTERKRAEEALLLSEQSSRQTAERLQMVNQIGEKINSGLGFDQLMQTIFEQCQQIGETDTFYVATYDDVTDMISFPFFYKDGEQRQIAPRNLKENSCLAGYIIQTRKTVYLPDESILPEGVVAVRTPGIYTQSFVGVPLILTERVVGVLSMQSNSLNAYTPEQIHTLELLATQLAIAIQNSQLYEQARVEQNLATELAEQLRIVNQISLKITSGLGFEQLMQTIYEQCLQIGFANTFYVGLYDHTTDILKLPVYFADGEAVYRPPVHLKENPGIASHVIERHQTIYVPDIHNMPAGMTPHTISPTPTKTRTYLGLPLILNGRVVGVLSMQSTSPDAYSPGQIKTLELLATQVAIAIQNSQLFEQVENEKNLVTAVIENLPGAVGLIDQHGNLKRWNKKAEEITGYATQDIEALDYLSLFPEEELARLPDLISEVFSSGRNSTDLQVISNDGRKIPFYVTATRVHIGTEDLLLFIAMDITERKLMEQDIIQNEAIFSSFMENSPVYVFFKDKDIRALRLSSNFDQLLGIPVHQALGKTMDELFPSELARNMVADDLRILHEGQKVDVVEELNGRIYETTKFPIFKDGKPVMLAGFTIDVTERKQAERRLLEVMAAIESASDAIGISDAQGGHFFQNKALSDLLGYKTAEELQAAGGGPAAVKDQSIAKKMFDSIMDGDPWAGELEMVTKDGRVFPAYERANAIKDDAGNIIGLIGIITDITERKKTEQALLESEALNQAVITNSPSVSPCATARVSCCLPTKPGRTSGGSRMKNSRDCFRRSSLNCSSMRGMRI